MKWPRTVPCKQTFQKNKTKEKEEKSKYLAKQGIVLSGMCVWTCLLYVCVLLDGLEDNIELIWSSE